MATGTTKAANVVVPEVWGDVAQAEFVGQARVLNSGATLQDNTLAGQPGDTINFPKWGTLTDLDDLTEGVAMSPEVLAQTSSDATIKEAGKAVEFSDNTTLNGLGDIGSEARRQFGILAARKVDGDLISAAVAAGAYTSATLTGVPLSWAAIVDAISKFGDDWDPAEFAGLFIRSDQQAELFADDQFINASKLGGDTPVQKGQIGSVGGLPVFVTNRLASTKAAMIKRNALGALYKRQPIVETDRDILKRTTVVTTNLHYAVKRLDDKGVCVITVTP